MEHEQHIELHLHTKLSPMDALIDVEELFEFLAQVGCPAVAITDHGNVQAFPTVAAPGQIIPNCC